MLAAAARNITLVMNLLLLVNLFFPLISKLVLSSLLGQVEPLFVNVDLIKHISEHVMPNVYVV